MFGKRGLLLCVIAGGRAATIVARVCTVSLRAKQSNVLGILCLLIATLAMTDSQII
ncbi:MAG: hypothetical protein K2N54_02625 [Helicobacter sp.]|nr:hypothetical protein [Helicobacter sp.]